MDQDFSKSLVVYIILAFPITITKDFQRVSHLHVNIYYAGLPLWCSKCCQKVVNIWSGVPAYYQVDICFTYFKLLGYCAVLHHLLCSLLRSVDRIHGLKAHKGYQETRHLHLVRKFSFLCCSSQPFAADKLVKMLDGYWVDAEQVCYCAWTFSSLFLHSWFGPVVTSMWCGKSKGQPLVIQR